MLTFMIQILHICALLLLWASSNFVTLVRCLSYLLDQDHVHSTSWTSTLEVSYAIPSIHKIKTSSLMISLSSIFQMRHERYIKKRWHAWHPRCLHSRIVFILCIMFLIYLKKDLIVKIKGYLCKYDLMQGPFYNLIWIGRENIDFGRVYL